MYKNIYLKFYDLVHMAVKGKVHTYCGKVLPEPAVFHLF